MSASIVTARDPCRQAEAHRRAGRELAGERQVGREHDREHRVAARGRVVGAEDDRQARRRHLDRAGDEPFREELAAVEPREGGPSRRIPTRFEAEPTRQTARVNAASASGGNQSSRGPGRTVSVGSAGSGTSATGPARGPGGLDPDRKHVAVAERRRAEPRQHVVRAAAERRRDGEAAAHRDVGTDAVAAAAELEHLTGRHLGGHRALERPARDGRVRLGPGDRDQCGLREAECRPEERRLERGGVRVVADDAVPELERVEIGRARRRDAELRQAGPAAILDGRQRPGSEDVHLVHARAKRTRSPAASSAGGPPPDRRGRATCVRAAASLPASRADRRPSTARRSRRSRPGPVPAAAPASARRAARRRR